MLDFEFMLQIAPKMFSALWITVQLSCLAVLFSILFGAVGKPHIEYVGKEDRRKT